MSQASEFTAEDILRFAQWLCPKAGIHTITTVPTNHTVGAAVGKTGRKETHFVLVAHQRWPHILGFRSILTIKNPGKAYSWLINGQPGRNTHALRFDGENGPCLIPSHERMREVFETKYGCPQGTEGFQAYWDRWMKGAGSRALENQFVVAVHLGYTNEIIEPLT